MAIAEALTTSYKIVKFCLIGCRTATGPCWRDATLEVGWQKSIRYCGAWPCMQLYIMTLSKLISYLQNPNVSRLIFCRCQYCYVHRSGGRFIGNRYGAGSGQIWLSNVRCSDTKKNIAHCRHSGWGSNSCSHSEDVSVSCLTGNSLSQFADMIYLQRSPIWVFKHPINV